MRSAWEIIQQIDQFQPVNGNWLALDSLLDELFASGSASDGIDVMLGVFERFPTEDGAEVLWSIVHGLERLEGYESQLVESVQLKPSFMAVIMVRRLINAGIEVVDDERLEEILDQLRRDDRIDPEIRRAAQR